MWHFLIFSLWFHGCNRDDDYPAKFLGGGGNAPQYFFVCNCPPIPPPMDSHLLEGQLEEFLAMPPIEIEI